MTGKGEYEAEGRLRLVWRCPNCTKLNASGVFVGKGERTELQCKHCRALVNVLVPAQLFMDYERRGSETAIAGIVAELDRRILDVFGRMDRWSEAATARNPENALLDLQSIGLEVDAIRYACGVLPEWRSVQTRAADAERWLKARIGRAKAMMEAVHDKKCEVRIGLQRKPTMSELKRQLAEGNDPTGVMCDPQSLTELLNQCRERFGTDLTAESVNRLMADFSRRTGKIPHEINDMSVDDFVTEAYGEVAELKKRNEQLQEDLDQLNAEFTDFASRCETHD